MNVSKLNTFEFSLWICESYKYAVSAWNQVLDIAPLEMTWKFKTVELNSLLAFKVKYFSADYHLSVKNNALGFVS